MVTTKNINAIRFIKSNGEIACATSVKDTHSDVAKMEHLSMLNGNDAIFDSILNESAIAVSVVADTIVLMLNKLSMQQSEAIKKIKIENPDLKIENEYVSDIFKTN